MKGKLTSGTFLSANASAVTVHPGRIFLGDRAFQQGGVVGSTDLAGTIVHELFHVAGLGEKTVRALNGDIAKYCGSGGRID